MLSSAAVSLLAKVSRPKSVAPAGTRVRRQRARSGHTFGKRGATQPGSMSLVARHDGVRARGSCLPSSGTFATHLQMAPSTLASVDGALIETRPGVRSGKPCFVGTRIAVYDVLDYLASGMTTGEIVADFPELTPQHVRAALEFAATRERRLASA